MIGEIAGLLGIAVVAMIAALLKSRMVRVATGNQRQEQEQTDEEHDASR